VFVEEDEKCLTPDLASGQCIIIDECSALLQMMAGKFDRDTIDFLRSSTCGFDGETPKVSGPFWTKFTRQCHSLIFCRFAVRLMTPEPNPRHL
jgi:hypothetical protein